MIFIAGFIILIIILLLRHKNPVEPAEENITVVLLDVTYEKVQGKDWCLPASAAMVFGYYGENITQSVIASRVITNSDASTFRLVSYAKELGYLAEWKRKSIKEIEGYLREGVPLIAIQKYSQSIANTHCRVITGFDSVKAELTLHDSAGKSNYKMSYKEFTRLGFDSSGMFQIIVIKEMI